LISAGIILRCGLWIDIEGSASQFEDVPGRICRPYGGIPGEQDCKVKIWSLTVERTSAAYAPGHYTTLERRRWMSTPNTITKSTPATT